MKRVDLRSAAALLAVLVASLTAATSATATGVATGAEGVTAYEPLAFLVGHCWKGTFPDGKVTDEHCFSWIYGGKFIRDEHVVHNGAGRPDGFGESIYVWDAPTGQLQYLYIESAGGFSRGTVSSEADALVFPAATYSEKGEVQTYRSRWKRVGDDAYDVVTEFRHGDRWVPGFTIHMQKVLGGA
jgi:hypothetical protein